MEQKYVYTYCLFQHMVYSRVDQQMILLTFLK